MTFELKKIEINKPKFEITYKDGFTASIEVGKVMNMGYTMYSYINAGYQNGDLNLGLTFIAKEYRGSCPRKNSNTIKISDLGEITERLHLIKNNSIVRENSRFGQDFYELNNGVDELLNHYGKLKEISQKRLAREEKLKPKVYNF